MIRHRQTLALNTIGGMMQLPCGEDIKSYAIAVPMRYALAFVAVIVAMYVDDDPQRGVGRSACVYIPPQIFL